MEYHELSLPLVSKGPVLGVATRTLTNRELHSFPHTIIFPEHEWDKQNVHFPKGLRTVEEISRKDLDVKN